MKSRNIYMVAILLIVPFLCRCSYRLPDAGEFDVRGPLDPLVIRDRSSVVTLTDYTDFLSHIDSVKSTHIKIEKGSQVHFDTLGFVLTDLTPRLSTIGIYVDGVCGSLLIENRFLPQINSGEDNLVPVLKVSRIKEQGNRIEIVTENSPASYIIFWQNTLLSSRFLKYLSPGVFDIIIPENAREMERSYIRVYASNRFGIGSSLEIPLNRGRVEQL